MIGLIIVMGVYPKPFLDRIEPSVTRLVHHVETNSDYTQPTVATKGEQVVPEDERRAEAGAGEDGATSGEGGN
jgi:hypothetical protein